jgi:CheY-like chemotaxis protein
VSLVLVADDEPAVLDALSQVVEDLGHQVVRAHDGREALQLARAQRPSLVVTDHMMPRLSGLDLVRQMQEDEQLRRVPVLLLSAALPMGAPTGARACLPKPFELSDFERLVASLLAEVDGQAGGPQPPGGPPDGARGRLEWLARGLAAPLQRMRGQLEALRRELGVAASEPARRQVSELARAVEEMERMVQRAVPPGP